MLLTILSQGYMYLLLVWQLCIEQHCQVRVFTLVFTAGIMYAPSI